MQDDDKDHPYDIFEFNGSVDQWYDPYLNKIFDKQDDESLNPLISPNNHLLVPLLFTQSGTKPIISIHMIERYVHTYQQWKASDAIVVVGFNFNDDDEHINNIIRTLVDEDKKQLIIVTIDNKTPQEFAYRLKIKNYSSIQVVQVNNKGKLINPSNNSDELWIDHIAQLNFNKA